MESNGRGKAFVNGRRVPMSNLKEIMGTLVDIVGQHSHQMLLHKGNHIKLIDRFLDKDETLIKDQIEKIVSNYEETQKLLKQLSETRNNIKRKKGTL